MKFTGPDACGTLPCSCHSALRAEEDSPPASPVNFIKLSDFLNYAGNLFICKLRVHRQ